jgi:membrane fusion protein (multidrug efflux system)
LKAGDTLSFYPKLFFAHCATVALISVCLVQTSCGSSKGLAKGTAATKMPPPSVTIAIVKVMTVPVTGDFIGQSSAKETVSIVPRVTGFLEQIYFKEGAEVHTGEALIQIEQASYKIAVESAQSKLAQDAAQLVKYQRDVARLAPLTAQHAATQTDLDTAVSGAAQQKAAMEGDQASIDTAQLNLSYTTVSSPIDGIIGKLGVTKGNVVNAAQTTALAVISSFDPIYVDFSVPEALYLTLRRKNLERKTAPRIPLNLVLADGKPFDNTGYLDFTDRTVDAQTGTLSARGVFRNPAGLIRPGEFARVRFVTQELVGAVLVPKGAITETLNTKAVLVLNEANQAMQKTVTLDGNYQDYFIVHSGLTGGERVVVEGVAKVHPGMTVAPSGSMPAGPMSDGKKR